MTMTSRRTFTFASLALAAGASTARAGAPQAQLSAPAPLGSRWTIERKPKELVVRLDVTNRTAEAIELLVKRGSSPGPDLRASLEVEDGAIALSEIFQGDRRELMSRIGPIPQYQTLAAGAELVLGPWHFTLPEGAEAESLSLTATVTTSLGQVVLSSGVVAPGTSKVAV